MDTPPVPGDKHTTKKHRGTLPRTLAASSKDRPRSSVRSGHEELEKGCEDGSIATLQASTPVNRRWLKNRAL